MLLTVDFLVKNLGRIFSIILANVTFRQVLECLSALLTDSNNC